ncbi:glycosyl hydrolase [Holotrichia oblita]|uniref:Glycosyl hydrolase n=1 Tax=Holotrichia oblita TaxID=644536 RepID=A0ACB9TPZ9_HOLOL|nr:glycosyl hydrolase [Holotrichia oblita]
MRRLVIALILACVCNAQDYEFPPDFEFGVGTAAYQIEGAWNDGGKGENIWDYVLHNDERFTPDSSNADDACLSYYKMDEDLRMLEDLGVDFYRFSISWSRILPKGHIHEVNQEGIDYYHRLIDGLIERNIKPVITMFHWDLPIQLHETGSWTNPRLVNSFVSYANLLFQEYGSKVNTWTTFNEPYQFCEWGYSTGIHAPAYTQQGIGGYLCGHTVLLAHAMTYRLYQDKYKEEYGGKVGITLHGAWREPVEPTDEDRAASETALQMTFGWFANAIFSENGDYPTVMREKINERSEIEEFPRSRLPYFTQDEIDMIKGSADFLGLNYYSTNYCSADYDESTATIPSLTNDIGASCTTSSVSTESWGLRKLLKWIKTEYNNPEILITENGLGVSSDSDSLDDCDRTNYFNSYLHMLLNSIYEDGINLVGYTAWTLMDNFEWNLGYTRRFGLYHVDFTDPDRPRTPKRSAHVYKNIISTRKIDRFFAPTSYEACIYTFPDEFEFGCATSSYQVEGAWNVDGKGENIWDYLTHTKPDAITDSKNGDIACNTYYKTEEDVQLLDDLGVDFYRFSLSWSRILPGGHANYTNPAGINYYNGLIDALIDKEITPLVTLFHWDLPQPLQEIGGWTNPLLVDLFVDYAEIIFENFGDRVKDWITFNEPYQICQEGYSEHNKAPVYNQDGIGGYLCAYTVLMAHAKTYEIYQRRYNTNKEGRMGITVHGIWSHPEDITSDADKEASESKLQAHFGMYLHPIYSEAGDFPPSFQARVDRLSEEEGFPWSRLPKFTSEEVDLLRGSADFLGFNHYATDLCFALSADDARRPSHEYDAGARCYKSNEWEGAASSWVKVVPWGFRKLLHWIKEQYNNPEVIVTENGFSTGGDDVTDCRRINYYNVYLEALLQAIYEDGCRVTKYTAWSFLDNFEWMDGYLEKFGLHSIDFDDPDRARTPKMSSHVYRNIINTRQIDRDFTPAGFVQCDFDVIPEMKKE